MVQRRGVGPVGQALLAGVLGCVAAATVVLTGRPMAAVAAVGVVLLGGLTVLERQRMAPVLWAGVAFTAPLQGVRVAASVTVSDVLIVAAFVTILPDVLRRGWRRVVPSGVVVAFGLLVVAGLLGTFFAPDVGASLSNLVRLALAAAGSVVAMALWDPGRSALRRFAWLWFAGAVTSALWAIAVPSPAAYLGRALGLANHPNHFGLVCELAVGLGLGLALGSIGRARMAALAGVAVTALGVGLSGSRSAILGLAVTIALTAVLTRRFRLLVATGVIVVLGAMAAIVGIVQVPESQAIARLNGGGGSAASDLERKQRLGEAFGRITSHPFTGQGFQFAQDAHNIYVQALVVGGPLALLGFLGVSGLIVRAGVRAIGTERDQRHRSLLSGLTAGYAGYLFSGFFDPILWDRYLWTYVGLLLVLAASTRQPSVGSRPPEGLLEVQKNAR